MSEQTFGQQYLDGLAKQDTSLTIEDIQRASEQEALEALKNAILHAQKKIDCSSWPHHDSNECKKSEPYTGDFFIECLIRSEKVFDKSSGAVIRQTYIPRYSCPTPIFDQVVYKYDAQKDDIEFLWVVPDKETATMMKKYSLEFAGESLLAHVIDFWNGTLYRLSKKLNKETKRAGTALE